MPRKARRVVCVGSRRLEPGQERLCRKIGEYLAKRGDRVITGNAPGADSHFRDGANSIDPNCVELHLPWEGFGADAFMGNRVIVQTEVEMPKNRRGSRASTPAFYARNRALIEHGEGADMVLAIPRREANGPRGGTAYTMSHAAQRGVDTIDLSTKEGLERILDAWRGGKRMPEGFSLSEEELREFEALLHRA